jgi:hypothetical protein
MTTKGSKARHRNWSVSPTLVLVLLAGCNHTVQAVADWRMVDRTLDQLTDRPPGEEDVAGPDGFVDDYDNAQGRLIRGVNGNISTKFPADGRYQVELDACGSSWAHATVTGSRMGRLCQRRTRRSVCMPRARWSATEHQSR